MRLPEFYVGVNMLVVRDGKILLGKRKGRAGEGEWNMPGGHLEHGESIFGAAARELLEEAGLVAESFEFVTLANGPQGERHYIHVGVRAVGVTGEPQNLEPEACYGWEWFDLEKLPSPVFPPHLMLILAALQNSLFYGQ